jgi:UDP-N-acetyl-D-galactosamine dehydrogenase
VYDPQANAAEVKHEYGLSMIGTPTKKYHAVVLAVSHDEFKTLDWNKIKDSKTVVFDVKGHLDKSISTARL